MIEPGWVGRRIVARVRPPGADAGRLSDVLGDLLALDASTARLSHGERQIELPLDLIVAARLVAPSTADILALERICARGWRAADTAELEGWLLRANDGFTGRANSALPLRTPRRPLADVLGDAAAWYASRDLPLRLQVPLPGRWILDAALDELGYRAEVDVHVLVSRLDVLLDALLDRPAGSAAEDEVALDTAPDEAWLAAYHYRGAELPATARALLTRHDQVRFASVRRAGERVAIARGALDDEWLGITALEVAPAYRREGLAQALLAATARWGVTHGGRRVYVQVASTNEPALALYDRLGFWWHHDYRYRTAPPTTIGA